MRRRGARPRWTAGPRPAAARLSSIPPTTSRAVCARGARPAVAILREQGVNSQLEMAAAFDRAGFDRSTCT
jgi:hypothetical protein